jgi:signal transduction histidine kinase
LINRNKRIIVKQKDFIAQQRIKELEREKVVVAATSALHGEERERSRLSRDLHDGLGGILSGVKLSLSDAVEKSKNPDEINSSLNKSYDLVVKSITELRRVSNALLPETLLNMGLNIAIKSYCDTFKFGNNKFEINYNFFGKELRFNKIFELAVYRLAQEIINNAIKHSDATEISIQLVIEDERLFLGIQDNGKGFDKDISTKKAGLGLNNIKQRIELYGGLLEINTGINKGTEVVIEFENLSNNKAINDKSFNS